RRVGVFAEVVKREDLDAGSLEQFHRLINVAAGDHPLIGDDGAGGLWIAWPKQASGVESDMTQNVVRETGLACGLVDYKVCAIDATWSGLKFARRKAK
ncbi:MAG TPA: hypothetical protein VIM99_07460, partial [Blastocatellia bacterium]